MSKRFKILEGALNYLRTSEAGANPQAPSGTPLREYQEWRAGERNISYERNTTSLPRSINRVSVIPFGVGTTETIGYLVPLSERARANVPGDSTLNAANVIVEPGEDSENVRGFIPAKATITTSTGQLAFAPDPSQLTGLRYKTKTRASWTIPYGQSNANARETAVRAAIRQAVDGTDGASVQFKSERL